MPEDAILWFDGDRTTSTGRLRQLESPPLEAARHYRYTLQARWCDKGREVTQNQQLRLSAGDEAVVTFPIPPWRDALLEDMPPAPPRFPFTIDPATPLKDLLPLPPKVRQLSGPLLGDDLTQVPELRFQAPPDQDLLPSEVANAIAFQMAKINHLNDKKTDGFLKALLAARTDLQGLPFAMGDACRSKGERSQRFAQAVRQVRRVLPDRASDMPESGGGTLERPGKRSARIWVWVPEDAALWFDGDKTTSTGRLRHFESPPLEPDRYYRYTLQARWHNKGRNVTQAQQLRLTAGDEAVVAFPIPPWHEEPPAGKPAPMSTTVENVARQMLTPNDPLEKFWRQLQASYAEEDRSILSSDRVVRDLVARSRVAALMQILAPESPTLRLGLVRYLATVAHVEATQALARLALFSAEDEVRQAAIDALKDRRQRDYTDILLAGLRYPLPAVARRAADALVKLERNDLVPRLVELLDEPDPRAPVLEKVEQKQVPVVRELVRVNHLSSCLLCHAPGQQSPGKTARVLVRKKRLSSVPELSPEPASLDLVEAAAPLTGTVPVPGESLFSSSQGYNNNNTPSELLVRVDVTYLRQDFSVLQAIENAHPGPKMQRFDFLVRKRVLTEEEAKRYRDRLAAREPGQFSPYHKAIVTALRELTGRDTGPTSSDWRKLLEQIEQARKAAEKTERASGS